MVLSRLRALFHPYTPNVETSHVTVLGLIIVYLSRAPTLYGHSGFCQIAVSFQQSLLFRGVLLPDEVVPYQEGLLQVEKGINYCTKDTEGDVGQYPS